MSDYKQTSHGAKLHSEMNSLDKMEDYDRLAAENAALKDQLDETNLCSKLIDAWIADNGGKQIPWGKVIELTSIVLKLPNEERDRLLCLDYPDFPAKLATAETQLQVLREQEPVAEIATQPFGENEVAFVRWVGENRCPPIGTKLYTSAPPAPIPEGWQLVPIEPTVEMREVMRTELGGSFLRTKQAYKAMLAAAQKGE